MPLIDKPVAELMKSLRSPLPDLRMKSARALAKLGPQALEALPALVAALDDADAGVREAAAQAVGQLGPEALPHLLTMLGHPDKYVRRHATWALGRLGAAARSAVPDLAAALKDADPRTAAGAAQALGLMGDAAAAAVPRLTEAMRGTNVVLCRMAAKALSQVGPAALPALIAHLAHRDPFVRGEAAMAVGWMGPAATSAVPALLGALRVQPGPPPSPPPLPTEDTAVTGAAPGPSAEESSRGSVAQALGRVGLNTDEVCDALTEAAADESELVRQAARAALKVLQ